MSVTTNSVFFTVRRVSDYPDTGWTFRVRGADFTTLLAEVYEFVECTVSVELNGPGAGAITLDLDSPMWRGQLANGHPFTELLTNNEYLWEAYQDGVLRCQWLATNVEEAIVGEGGTRAATISGPGAANVLTWAKVFPPGFPLPPDPQNLGLVQWPFTASTPAMQTFMYLFNAAQDRGTIPFVHPLFDATTDSGGVPWADVTTPFTSLAPYAPEMASTLLDQLNNLTGQDLQRMVGMRAEWFMWPGFFLDVRPVIGTHREDQVVFYEPGIVGNRRTTTRENVANVVVIRDSEGNMDAATDAASIAAFGRRENLVDNSALNDPGRRSAAAQLMLAQTKDELSSWVITVPYRGPGRLVFIDYDIGDWIGICSSVGDPGANTVVDPFRVLAISVQIPATGEPTLELTLESLMDAYLRDIQKRLTQIINKIDDRVTNILGPTTVNNNSTSIGLDQPTVKSMIDDALKNLNLDGISGLGGCHVWIQEDPPTEAAVGDFWYQP